MGHFVKIVSEVTISLGTIGRKSHICICVLVYVDPKGLFLHLLPKYMTVTSIPISYNEVNYIQYIRASITITIVVSNVRNPFSNFCCCLNSVTFLNFI